MGSDPKFSRRFNSIVASYTNFPNLRIDVEVTFGVAEQVDRVRSQLLQLVKKDDDFMVEPPPRVVVTQLNDYNVSIELRVWLKDERRHVSKRHQLRERIFETLTAAGVDMPFETIKLMPLEFRQHPDDGGSEMVSSIPGFAAPASNELGKPKK